MAEIPTDKKKKELAVNPGGGRYPGGRIPAIASAAPIRVEDNIQPTLNSNRYPLKVSQPSPMEPGLPPGQVGPSPDEFRGLVTKAGDAPVGGYAFQGLPIVVENPAGSTRTWKDEKTGEVGSTPMKFDYGFIDGVPGADGDDLDCFIGPDRNADQVFVVHQMTKPDFVDHDEDKCLLGFSSLAEAKAAYLAHYDSPLFLGAVTPMTMVEFKAACAKLKAGEPMMIRRRRWTEPETRGLMTEARLRLFIARARLRRTDPRDKVAYASAQAAVEQAERDDMSAADLGSGGALAPEVGIGHPPPSVTGKKKPYELRAPQLRRPVTIDGKYKLSATMPPVRHPTHDPLPHQMLPAPRDPRENPYRPPGLH